MIDLMAITNDVDAGRRCVAAGVNLIMVDLETYEKNARQKDRDTLISDHAVSDIGAMRSALSDISDASVVARCEPLTLPWWDEHFAEVIAQRPDSVMLPMVETKHDVARFVEALGNRAEAIVMIETKAALHHIDDLVDAAPDALFFVGLNDLHIQLGQRFMFESLGNGDVDVVAASARRRGAGFGFGGLARLGQGLLPSELIVREHVRLGSRLAILSRTFFNDIDHSSDVADLRSAVDELRKVETDAEVRSAERQDADKRSTQRHIEHVIDGLVS